MNAYFRGQLLTGPRGPAGPDGNPVGTVISFMGTKAPKDYLVCDGTECNISDYPALAAFFKEQFGTSNHFGGDGEATFAVPDMRNLFLRGYHGEAEEPLSGEIGEKQEATSIPNILTNPYSIAFYPGGRGTSDESQIVKNPDSTTATIKNSYITVTSDNGDVPAGQYYTARPINTAVLFCIKAVESVSSSGSAQDIYSTEEVKIGTWIDGKPLYRKVIEFQKVPIPSLKAASIRDCKDLNIEQVTHVSGIFCQENDSTRRQWGAPSHYTTLFYLPTDFNLYFYNYRNSDYSFTGTAQLEYTKTTD